MRKTLKHSMRGMTSIEREYWQPHNVIRRRSKSGLSVRQIAKRMGMSRSEVSRIVGQ